MLYGQNIANWRSLGVSLPAMACGLRVHGAGAVRGGCTSRHSPYWHCCVQADILVGAGLNKQKAPDTHRGLLLP